MSPFSIATPTALLTRARFDAALYTAALTPIDNRETIHNLNVVGNLLCRCHTVTHDDFRVVESLKRKIASK